MFTIHIAYRNADMSSGDGLMIPDKAFADEALAHAYTMQQTGVMGRKPGDFAMNNWNSLGDWEVRPMVVHENMGEVQEVEVIQLRERGLQKLTDEERLALGLE